MTIRSVKQSYFPSSQVGELMETFRSMVNDCVRIAIKNGATSMKKLCTISYGELHSRYGSTLSHYRLAAISKAAGIVAARSKSAKRGFTPRNPYVRKPLLTSCYQFTIEDNCLVFRVAKGTEVRILLTRHTLECMRGLELRSFTLTPTSLSLSLRKNIDPYNPKSFVGIDRNARNVTYGNEREAIQFDLAKLKV